MWRPIELNLAYVKIIPHSIKKLVFEKINLLSDFIGLVYCEKKSIVKRSNQM